MPARLIDSLATTAEMADVFSDESLLSAMLRFETALARAQARLGIIPQAAAEAISRAKPEQFDAAALARAARQSASIAVPFVKALTAQVRAIDSASAGFVHWGATSQDVIDTALVLLLRPARELMAKTHHHAASALRDLSNAHANTVMLSRSLLQAAPPITFGYKAAGWFGSAQRSWRRLEDSFDSALELQFGGASGTLASYCGQGPALAVELGKELHLRVPAAPWRAHRDRLARVMTDSGIYTAAIAKAAKDITLLSQEEVGEVTERGGGSSAMPNKRNPSGSVLVLAAAARMPGLVASYLSGMAQEHERAAGGWQAECATIAQVIETAASALCAFDEAVGGLTVNAGRMRANIAATHGTVFAEKAAMLLACGLGRTDAQSIAAQAAKGQDLNQGLANDSRASALLTPEQIEAIDRPEDYLGSAELFRRRLLEEE